MKLLVSASVSRSSSSRGHFHRVNVGNRSSVCKHLTVLKIV
jgi:hypothetical protein